MRPGRLRTLLAKREDPYAGADFETLRRLAGVLWLVNLALALAIAPLAPPTERIGAAGWAAFAALALVSLAFAWSQLRPNAPRQPLPALVKSYAGLGAVAAYAWLAGDDHAPYEQLFVLWACVTAVSHPPRRVVAYLGAVVAASLLPHSLSGWTAVDAADTGVRLVITVAIALLGTYWMTIVRGQRVASRRQREDALRLARVDALTGLPNRRAFDEALGTEIARSHRTAAPVSVVVLDLDAFKQINDEDGHLAGDRALRQVAAALRATLRRGDGCFRWGGDEFALLLPNSELADAIEAGERVAEAVRASASRPDGLPLTISWGVAVLGEGMTGEELIARADVAMMTRKASRSARVHVEARSPGAS
jgi:diguanylate cyclase (GGDEF)-like protein